VTFDSLLNESNLPPDAGAGGAGFFKIKASEITYASRSDQVVSYGQT
jgi:hypothetical protein